MLKYYRVLMLYCAALIISIHSKNETKQSTGKNIDRNIIDGDDHYTLLDLFNDSLSNLKLLHNREISMNQITLEEDQSVKFRNVTITKPSYDANSTLTAFHCVSGRYLELYKPLGCHELKGVFESTNNTVYPFVISMRNMQARFTMTLNSSTNNVSEETDIMIQHVKINDNESNTNEIARILSTRLSKIKSQILHRFWALITTEDLRTYSSTPKKYCLYPRVNGITRYYPVNETHLNSKRLNLTIEGTKVKNFAPSFIFRLYDYSDSAGFFLIAPEVDVTLSYHYGNEDVLVNASDEYDFKLGRLLIEGEVRMPYRDIRVTPGISRRFGSEVITDGSTWVFVTEILQKVINRDLDSIVRRVYGEVPI